MRRFKMSSFICVILIFTLFTTIVYADSNMSSWAKEEVNEAISLELVPDSLQNNYKSSIKRYEYVLLANKVLGLTNRDVSIKTMYPFTDIYGHMYEDDIVLAYNAGVILGDGKGSFRPDDEINRQEIASLICNLIKVIEPDVDVNSVSSKRYSDEDSISNWAKNYINYVYSKDIMKGIGKGSDGLDRIDPRGSATREQAMILLLRLSYQYELITNYDIGTIKLVTYEGLVEGETREVGEKIYTDSSLINDFANTTSLSLAKFVQAKSLEEGIEITGLDNDFFRMSFIDRGSVTFKNNKYQVEVNFKTNELPTDSELKIMIDILGNYIDVTEIETVVMKSKDILDQEQSYTFSQTIQEGVTIDVRHDELTDMYQIIVNIDNEI